VNDLAETCWNAAACVVGRKCPTQARQHRTYMVYIGPSDQEPKGDRVGREVFEVGSPEPEHCVFKALWSVAANSRGFARNAE